MWRLLLYYCIFFIFLIHDLTLFYFDHLLAWLLTGRNVLVPCDFGHIIGKFND